MRERKASALAWLLVVAHARRASRCACGGHEPLGGGDPNRGSLVFPRVNAPHLSERRTQLKIPGP